MTFNGVLTADAAISAVSELLLPSRACTILHCC